MRGRLFGSALIAIFVAVALGDAKAKCPAIPNVPWWGTNEHKKVIKYVNQKHDGDWEPYIAKWSKYQSRMQDVADRGGSVVVRKAGITLKGPELSKYADKIAQRVSVLRCLASQEADRGKGAPKAAAPVQAKSQTTSRGGKTASKFVCPAVPDVDWWGDVNHESIIALVNGRYDGNWGKYIKQWEKELDILFRRFELGEEVVVNMVGFRLEEEELGLYIGKVAQILAVSHCLANEEASR